MFSTLKAVSVVTGGRALYYPFVKAMALEGSDATHKVCLAMHGWHDPALIQSCSNHLLWLNR
jgi:hypothetical protein